MLEILRRAHRRERPGPPDRRNPNPHRPHEPRQRPIKGWVSAIFFFSGESKLHAGSFRRLMADLTSRACQPLVDLMDRQGGQARLAKGHGQPSSPGGATPMRTSILGGMSGGLRHGAHFVRTGWENRLLPSGQFCSGRVERCRIAGPRQPAETLSQRHIRHLSPS